MSVVAKVCGITSRRDALAAVSYGFGMIGLNFVKSSPRFIDLDVAMDIYKGIHRDIVVVGVFLDPDRSYVREILDSLSLDILQFHGSESAKFCEQFGLRYMKVFSVDEEFCYSSACEGYEEAYAHILDTKVGMELGGTGKTFDWSLWPKEPKQRLMLAGGLTPVNVEKAILETRPWGVDVASGVEGVDKRQKDSGRMAEFMDAVRRATD